MKPLPLAASWSATMACAFGISTAMFMPGSVPAFLAFGLSLGAAALGGYWGYKKDQAEYEREREP